MAIYCPQCATLSNVQSKVGPTGRLMRCERCGTTWLAREHPDDPYRRGRARALPPPTDVSDAIVIEHVGAAQAPKPPPWRPTPAKPAETGSFDLGRWQPLGAAFGGLLAFALLCVPLVGGLPQVAGAGRLPADADQLAFQNVRSETIEHGGASALVVEGEIVNLSGRNVSLPAVRVSLRSADGAEVRSWLVEPSTGGLAGGGSVGFRSAVLASPVPASEVTLSLAARETPR